MWGAAAIRKHSNGAACLEGVWVRACATHLPGSCRGEHAAACCVLGRLGSGRVVCDAKCGRGTGIDRQGLGLGFRVFLDDAQILAGVCRCRWQLSAPSSGSQLSASPNTRDTCALDLACASVFTLSQLDRLSVRTIQRNSHLPSLLLLVSSG